MSTKNLIVLALGLFLIFGKVNLPKIGDGIKLPDIFNPQPVAVVAEPAADLKTAVAPVTAALKGHTAEAGKLADYFADFATVVGKKPDLFKTSGVIRQQQATAAALFGELNPASVAGIGDAINKAMESMLGLENAPVENSKAVAALNALSWACAQAE